MTKNGTINFSGVYASNVDIEILNWYIFLADTINTTRLLISQTQQLQYTAPDSACTLSFIFQAKTVDDVVDEDTVIAYVITDTILIVNAGQDQTVPVDVPVVLHATYTGDNIIHTYWKIGSDNFVHASPETTFTTPKTPLLLPCIFKVITSDNREAVDTLNLDVISLDSLRVVANAGNDTSATAGSHLTLHGTFKGNNITHTFWKIGKSDFTPAPLYTTITLPDTPTVLQCVLKVKNAYLEALDTVTINVLTDDQLSVFAFEDTAIQAGSPLKIHGRYTGNVQKTFWKIGSGSFTHAPPETTITVPDTAMSLVCILKVQDLVLNEAVDTAIVTVADIINVNDMLKASAGRDIIAPVNSMVELNGSYTGMEVMETLWNVDSAGFVSSSPDTGIQAPSSPEVWMCIFKIIGSNQKTDQDTMYLTTVIPTLQAYAGEDHFVTADTTVILEGLGLDTVNPNNAIIKYEWKYDNGLWIESADGTGIYDPTMPGSIICSLRVTAADGQTATDFCNISVLSKIDMVLIPSRGKTFRMGKTDNQLASPVHNVTFSKNFFISKKEITQKEYVALLDTNPSPVRNDNLPVYNCNWFDAVYYCNARSKSEKLDTVYSYTFISGTIGCGCHMENVKIDYTKKGYRLPTESEWEFACRAGTTTDYYWGDFVNTRYLWYRNNSLSSPIAVGRKLSNSFELYDMSGNVKEWCNDWYAGYTKEDKVDPKGPDAGSMYHYRVVRNGSYREEAGKSTSFNRIQVEPHTTDEKTGFRIVLEQ